MRKVHAEVIAALNSFTPKRFDGGKYRVEHETVVSHGAVFRALVAFHYATPIIMLLDGTYILNVSRYSPTTSQFQSAARQLLPRRLEVDNLDRGVSVQTLYNASL